MLSQSISGLRFPSRRSMVQGRRGAVATSHPLAAQAGLRILLAGGNAFDAAVATAATLNVVEPMSTGIGGDMFALCCVPGDPKVHALNGSGRAPKAASVEDYRRRFGDAMPQLGIHSVTVPGACDGWATLLSRFGTMNLKRVLEPAIEYAEEGFPVSERIARNWHDAIGKLAKHVDAARTYLIDGRAPRSGEIFRSPNLAHTFRLVGENGPDIFYRGEIAEKLVDFLRREGGLFTREDFAIHTSTWDEAIRINYRGYDIWECPPNGHGLVALLALNVLKGFDLGKVAWGSSEHVHLVIEAIKLSFADGYEYIADPRFADIPVAGLLSEQYGAARRALIDPNRAGAFAYGVPPTNDTVYLTVVDAHGNACSFINSLYHGFGSGLVAGDTGIALQNRAGCFVLDPRHRNCVAGGKRPYQTIIPAMVTREGKPWLSYGVMGGFMQPQGHVWVLSNVVDFGMNPQEALDAPRLRVERDGAVAVEPAIGEATISKLREMGHRMVEEGNWSMAFGGGQAILIDPASGALAAASDPRKDGVAVAY